VVQATWQKISKIANFTSARRSVQRVKGVLNPNFRPFSFELKKLDFLE